MRAGQLQSLWPARSIDDDYADSRKFVGGAAQAQTVGSNEGKSKVCAAVLLGCRRLAFEAVLPRSQLIPQSRLA